MNYFIDRKGQMYKYFLTWKKYIHLLDLIILSYNRYCMGNMDDTNENASFYVLIEREKYLKSI